MRGAVKKSKLTERVQAVLFDSAFKRLVFRPDCVRLHRQYSDIACFAFLAGRKNARFRCDDSFC
jgi:hypothetical protein